jgi:DNA-binding GntR family transcriptional regulator
MDTVKFHPNLLRHARTTSDLIADALRQAIQQGQLRAGQVIRQEELAAQFQVSRIPVREALQQLEAEGLVSIPPNRRAVVTALTADEVREVYDLRALIEGDLLRRSVPLLTPHHLQRATMLCAALDREVDVARQGGLNHEFHRVLIEPAGRSRQLAIVENLRNLVERFQYMQQSLLTHTADFQRDHWAILETCQHGDAEGAHRALQAHLSHAAEIALNFLSQPEPRLDGEGEPGVR